MGVGDKAGSATQHSSLAEPTVPPSPSRLPSIIGIQITHPRPTPGRAWYPPASWHSVRSATSPLMG